MGKNRRNRKRHLTDVNTSAYELPNAIPMTYQPQIRPNTIRSTSSRRSLLPHPLGYPFSDIPSRFSSNSASRRWLSPFPFWHAKYVFPPVRVPVAIVPPLPGIQVEVSAANESPVSSTLSTPIPKKSSGTQSLAEETRLSATSSEQTATDTVSVQPTIHQDTKSSRNTEGSDTASNTAPNEEDDVVYLYRVEPEKEKLIEIVDLSEDSNETSSNRNLVLSSRSPSSRKEAETKQDLKNSPESQEVLEIHSSITASEKINGSGLPIQTGRKRKREENLDTQCSVCHKDYEGACKDDYLLFISKCGHMFCLRCLRSLVPYKCTECNAGISNLCKVIF